MSNFHSIIHEFYINPSLYKKISDKLERIMVSVLCVSMSFAFLLLNSALPLLHVFEPFDEVFGAIFIAFSWFITGRFINGIDKTQKVSKENRNMGYFIAVILAMAVAVYFNYFDIQKELIKLGSLSIAVFIGAFISIEKLYSKPVDSAQEFFTYIISQFHDPEEDKRKHIGLVNTITCTITAVIIFCLVCLDKGNGHVSIAFRSFGIGIATGAGLVVIIITIIDMLRRYHKKG